MALQHERTDGTRRSSMGRPSLDPVLRRRIYGPIRPMETPGILQRLLGRW
ncbi:hypothetical protein [Novosphingobium soli]|uniref:Uncharacterized protein n=1 Tax=Novosphingobium soli TaxID=574956 RepID=A0ABV6CX41_9SPHN